MTTATGREIETIYYRFKNTVLGYVREHENNVSINIACVIKSLCLEYYLLKEEWTSCWARYPLHWIELWSTDQKYTDDWSERATFKTHQFAGYLDDSGHLVPARIMRMMKDQRGDVYKLLLSIYTVDKIDYGWVKVPNVRIRKPNPDEFGDNKLYPVHGIHGIFSPHLNAVSGSLPVGALDDSVAEYRWTLKVIQSNRWRIGLRLQSHIRSADEQRFILGPGERYGVNHLCEITLPSVCPKAGEEFDVVLDVIDKSLRLGSKAHERTRDSQFETLSQSVNQLDKRAPYFLVIDHCDDNDKSIFTDNEFTVEHSQRTVKLTGFSTKKKHKWHIFWVHVLSLDGDVQIIYLLC